MIGVDWGLTRFRAFRIGRDGTLRDRRDVPKGVLLVPDGRFGDTLREEVGPWLAAGEDRILICGMAGSAQGWRETPLLPCPAGIPDVAASLFDIGFDWAQVKLVPGLSGSDSAGVAEQMRGEETQVFGIDALLRDGGVACVPNLHSRWVTVRGGQIVSLSTHMTGEVFGALRGHTSLARMMRDGPTNGAPFDAGVARSAEPGGLLHHLSGVRAEIMAGRLQEADAPAYLSGILVGHEIRAALTEHSVTLVHVIGLPEMTALYAKAAAACGIFAERHDGEAVACGLRRIGEAAHWHGART